MRFFLAFAIVACVASGAWLWQGHDFYWPARGDPTLALYLTSDSARLLGAGLLATGGLGVMAVLQARRGGIASRHWQYAYFALAMLVVGLIVTALWQGEIVPNPESSAAQSRP
ncbi:MAG: hypothetical protein LPJ87_05165 [Zoogloeaceae bacterium]|nr:hypothetical protein [Zoogloeaceae bacterium]